mmetsp:Transcript_38950/g.91573  ORF Transcript_38950/g.91573 Transcript_38950/m.91573 type:complete len:227 (-) Transcript_38950:103-783(-)
MTTTLKTVVFMGSSRSLVPPWGGDSRLGSRVLQYVTKTLAARSSPVGKSESKVVHEVTVFDPLEVFGEGGALAQSGCELAEPHFFFKPGSAPAAMDAMRDAIKNADAILIVTAEYNHAPPPALLSMLDHFGGSNYSGKPSGIVTYSNGPWGGARCAMSIQPVLHELGCLPVSKMVHLPAPQELLKEDGAAVDDTHRMLKQLPGMLDQLEWMAVAMKTQRDATGLWA